MFIFPLIGKKRPILYIIILIIWNLGIFLGIASMFFRGSILFSIFLGAFLLSTLIWLIGNLVIKKYKIIGNIKITSGAIIINEYGNIKDIDILKTKKLIIKYFGTKGDSIGAYAGSLRIKDGSGNLISFEYEEQQYKLEFLITKKHFLNSIHSILKSWQEKNVSFKILTQYKKDITLNVLNLQGRY
jgi:hypothetical protein